MLGACSLNEMSSDENNSSEWSSNVRSSDERSSTNGGVDGELNRELW